MAVRSCWPSRRRVCSAGWTWWIWGRGGCGICRRQSGCFRYEQQGCAQSSRPCGRWMQVRGTCGLLPRASSGARPGARRTAPPTSFGGASEVAELQAAMKAHRLVTLTGVGGVGKTRLALEVAGRLADEFPDGVWVFELPAVTDPAAVPDAVAAVLGITQQPGKSVAESVAAALEGRLRLLVFDNCEHLLDAAADLIEAILAASAATQIVATRREGLGIADEQLWPVPSLDVGSGVDSAAVALFVERAQHVSPRFAVGDAGEGAGGGVWRRRA